MPLHIFKIRNLVGANSLMLFMTAGMFSVFFFTTLYLQEVLGYTPIRTGLSFLIMPFIIALVATNIPRIIKKVGYRPILIVAPLFVASGLFYLSRIPVDGTFWGNVAPGLALMAMGMGATFVSVSIAATDGVPHDESGLASGVLNTSQQIGGALGLAVLTGIASSSIKHQLSSLHTRPDQQAIAAATVHGFHNGYLIAACFALVASVIAAVVLRQSTTASAPSAEPVSIA
jgi:predicted MFS family arabinose efflux permease